MSTNLAPFKLIETSPGKHSLLLTTFAPATEVFERFGSEGGGYAWEGIARHILAKVEPELAGRLGLDPESSMFCAYGDDRDALATLGARLAALFHDPAALTAVIELIGPAALDD